MTQDRIYSRPRDDTGAFRFDDVVADVFPDMIARSVPGYAAMLSMAERIARLYARPHTDLYDLGCSLGAATDRLRRHAPASCLLHAIDSSPSMISRLRRRLDSETDAQQCRVAVRQADIREVSVQNASVVVMNLTLQFIPPGERRALLQKISDGMLPGGVLMLSEKICFDDPDEQTLMTALHEDFKRSQGYSDLEIARKRAALENTLIPESVSVHLSRLRQCGFVQANLWLQHLNFVSILAIR